MRSLVVKKSRRIVVFAGIAAMTIAAGARIGSAFSAQETGAQPQTALSDKDQKRKEKKLAAGEPEAKQLLLLMDQDKSGKVSKQEFMSFMEAEFERLDVNKDGELDVRELIQSRIVPRGGTHR